MKEVVGLLRSKRKDFEDEVETNKPKVTSQAYKYWICRVEDIENEVKELEAQFQKEGKHSSLSKQMQKMAKRIVSLLEASYHLKLFINPRLEVVKKNKKAPQTKDFETLQQPLDRVLDLLKKKQVSGVGICGTMGIGKSTIMWNLNNNDEVANMFDIVIWLTVSTEGNTKNLRREDLQQAIVRRLKIEIEGNNNADEIADKISLAMKGTKYLLLLDDVKECLNLSQLGIPEKMNGCKLVLTTRFRHVCFSMVDQMIEVANLSQDESWDMFQHVLQNPKLIHDMSIRGLAWRVCKLCNGLPLLIEKVASSFKLKNDHDHWKEGLDSWRKWPEEDQDGIWEIYKLLKFCYDDLGNDMKKKCFLYSALYPENWDIYEDYLLECWAAEGFLHNDGDGKMEHAAYGKYVLKRLKSVSLLEEGKSKNHVIINKCMRQVALYISENDPDCKYLVKTSKALREAPDEESWSGKNAISLGDNKFYELPESPICRALSTLLLQKNLGLEVIPKSFFEHMLNLRVLDLSLTGIESLPLSISVLINLKVLCLNDCENLKELPSHVSELSQLETLDIRKTEVYNIPPVIAKLTHLKHLKISFTRSSYESPCPEIDFDYSLISKLSKLEKLVIDVKSPGQWTNEVIEEMLKNVAALKKFRTLQVCFKDEIVKVLDITSTSISICVPEAKILQSFIDTYTWRKFQRMESFQLFIGCHDPENLQINDFPLYEKYVKYRNGEGNQFPVVEVLIESDAFELVNHKGIKQLSDLENVGMSKVRIFVIESCNAMECIFGTMGNPVLPKLEHLYLKSLPNLSSIWKGQLQPRSIIKLKTLVLSGCQMLIKVFPRGSIQQLHELQYLRIEECPRIKELVLESEVAGILNVLPKLKEMVLIDMPELESICRNESLDWPCLGKLRIYKCPGLCGLPFNPNNAKKLELIEAEQEWWDILQWENDEVKNQLKKSCTLSLLR
ncbi:hypothetical protein NMG60_11032497 [Bertholletia excelsa]